MLQVGFQVSFVLECDKETMRIALIFALGANIGAPFEIDNFCNLVLQCDEGSLNIRDVLAGREILEAEQDDMAIGRGSF